MGAMWAIQELLGVLEVWELQEAQELWEVQEVCGHRELWEVLPDIWSLSLYMEA